MLAIIWAYSCIFIFAKTTCDDIQGHQNATLRHTYIKSSSKMACLIFRIFTTIEWWSFLLAYTVRVISYGFPRDIFHDHRTSRLEWYFRETRFAERLFFLIIFFGNFSTFELALEADLPVLLFTGLTLFVFYVSSWFGQILLGYTGLFLDILFFYNFCNDFEA